MSSAPDDKLPPGVGKIVVQFDLAFTARDRNRGCRPHDVFDKCVFNATTANGNSFQRDWGGGRDGVGITSPGFEQVTATSVQDGESSDRTGGENSERS